MSTQSKPKMPQYTSPVAVAIYPKLNRPDSYTPPGSDKASPLKYKLKFKIQRSECEQMLALIDAETARAVEEGNVARADKPKKDKKTGKPLFFTDESPYAVETDDTGAPTGFIVFSASTHALNKDGSPKSLPLFDGKGKNFPVTTDIWGGSKVKVNFGIGTYQMDATDKAGATLYLNAVQVIELVTKGGGSADKFGFKAEADGYEAPVDPQEAFAPESGTTDVPKNASGF